MDKLDKNKPWRDKIALERKHGIHLSNFFVYKRLFQGLVSLWQIGLLVCAGEFDKYRGTREKGPDSQYHRSIAMSYLISKQIDLHWNPNEVYLGYLETWQKSINSANTSPNLLLGFPVHVKCSIWDMNSSVRGWKLSTPFLALSWVLQSIEKEQVCCQWQSPICECRKPSFPWGLTKGMTSPLGHQLDRALTTRIFYLTLHSQETPSLLLPLQQKHLLCRSINYKLKASTYSG